MGDRNPTNLQAGPGKVKGRGRVIQADGSIKEFTFEGDTDLGKGELEAALGVDIKTEGES